MKINTQLAVNSLSFGFVSFHILREFWKRGIDTNWFPIGGNVDFSSFDKAEPDFLKWAQNAANKAPTEFNKHSPNFRLWHAQGSWEWVGSKQHLFVFHETDALTPTEVNIFNQQESVIVSSEHTKNVLEQYGVTTPVHYIPLGFDNLHFKKLEKKYYNENVTCWLIAGKAELRKSNIEIAKLWLQKYGNNKDHMLHLMITNPFFKPEQNQVIINQITEGKKYSNLNPLPYVGNLTQLNDCYNAADIVIDISRGEGWSLPSFNCLALGKHGLIHNCSAMKGWANESNSVLVEPVGKIKAVDNVFFHENSAFNVGNFFNWNANDVLNGMDKVLTRKQANRVNEAGLELQKTFTWGKTVDQILSVIYSK